MMESKLLLMMKGKFESLFILYTVYKMMEPWKHEPVQKKEKKQRGTGEGLWCLRVTLSCLCILIFLNQDCRECKGLIISTFSLPNWSFPPPPPLPASLFLTTRHPLLSGCGFLYVYGDEEFVNYYTRWLIFVILQSNIKATCCIKHGFWFDLLPRNALKCCS